MDHQLLPLPKAAAHVHVAPNELKHVAQRGEIAAVQRGDDWFFEHAVLDEWAQRNLLSASPRERSAQHREMMDERRRAHHGDWGVSDLLRREAICLDVTAKAKAGLLRDMTDLAEATGLVYDAEGLYHELVAREEAASTAIGEGVALLHPRFHDPYLFEETFLAYGRTVRPVFFGAPDGAGTRHFFLICSTDHEMHMHILARLAVLAHGTDLLERLETVETADEVLSALSACEAEYRT